MSLEHYESARDEFLSALAIDISDHAARKGADEASRALAADIAGPAMGSAAGEPPVPESPTSPVIATKRHARSHPPSSLPRTSRNLLRLLLQVCTPGSLSVSPCCWHSDWGPETSCTAEILGGGKYLLRSSSGLHSQKLSMLIGSLAIPRPV